MTERAYRRQELDGAQMAHAEQCLGAVALIQAFGAERRQVDRLRQLGHEAVLAHQRGTVLDVAFRVAVGLVTATATAGILYLGGLLVLDGLLTVGDLLIFLSYLAALFGPLVSLTQVTAGHAAASARARRVLEVLGASDRVVERPDAVNLSVAWSDATLDLDGVEFGYQPETTVLHDISLSVAPGQMVALVGATGSGKSTLMSLIPRLYDPWHGRVALAGKDIRELRLDSLRSQISIVLQEPFLLPLSVADNIAYGGPAPVRPM